MKVKKLVKGFGDGFQGKGYNAGDGRGKEERLNGWVLGR